MPNSSYLYSTQRMPTDLVDIFFHIMLQTEDVISLKASSLVCREWHALARPYIFRVAIVRPGTDLEWNLRFTSTPFTHILHLIRELSLRDPVTDEADESNPALRSLDISWILSCLASNILPNLKTLHINFHAFFYGDGSADAILESATLRRNLAQLEILKLERGQWPLQLLAKFISKCSGIQTLSLTDTDLSTFSTNLRNILPFTKLPPLKNVILDIPGSRFPNELQKFLQWIVTPPNMPSPLRSLSISISPTASVEEVKRYSFATGAHLSLQDLTIISKPRCHLESNVYDLFENRNLQTLTLVFNNDPHISALQLYVILIRISHSPYLHTITVVFQSVETFRFMRGSRHSLPPSLRTLDLRYSGVENVEWSELLASVREVLPEGYESVLALSRDT